LIKSSEAATIDVIRSDYYGSLAAAVHFGGEENVPKKDSKEWNNLLLPEPWNTQEKTARKGYSDQLNTLGPKPSEPSPPLLPSMYSINADFTDEEKAFYSPEFPPRTADPDVGVWVDQPPDQPVSGPVRNILHSYPSYTYNIGLHILTPDMYNAMVTSTGPSHYRPRNNVLIASGGAYGKANSVTDPSSGFLVEDSNQPRNEFFRNTDYFIDELQFETIIGMGGTTHNSNVSTLSFKIIEPNSFALFENLVRASNSLGISSYLNASYLLVISFKGYSADGVPAVNLVPHTKHIPIKITGFNVKVSAKGAEYTVEGVAFSHAAIEPSATTLPTQISVNALTVEDFFNSIVPDKPSASSFLTAHAKKTAADAKPNALKPDTYSFEIFPELAKSPVSRPEDLDPNRSAMSNIGGAAKNNELSVAEKKAIAEKKIIVEPVLTAAELQEIDATVESLSENGLLSNNTKEQLRAKQIESKLAEKRFNEAPKLSWQFQFEKGLLMTDMITKVILSSDYIRQQFPTDATTPSTAAIGNTIDWFKIVPLIRLGEYDAKANRYQKHYTFRVLPYKKIANGFPGVGIQIPDRAQLVKEYDYIFTGKNMDVTKLDIEFNTMYYIGMTSLAEQLSAGSGIVTSAPAVPEEDTGLSQSVSGELDGGIAPAAPVDDSGMLAPPATFAEPVVVTENNQTNKTTSSSPDTKQARINDFMTFVMKRPSADMIVVELGIVGDPQFIKQDNVFYAAPVNDSDPNSAFVGAHMKTDAGDVLVQLNFYSPSDYNEETGLLDNVHKSAFSGIYRVQTVANSFSRGKFEQTLSLIRLFGQDKADTLASQKESAITGTTEKERVEEEVRLLNALQDQKDELAQYDKDLSKWQDSWLDWQDELATWEDDYSTMKVNQQLELQDAKNAAARDYFTSQDAINRFPDGVPPETEWSSIEFDTPSYRTARNKINLKYGYWEQGKNYIEDGKEYPPPLGDKPIEPVPPPKPVIRYDQNEYGDIYTVQTEKPAKNSWD
jgi:hypothetical protein